MVQRHSSSQILFNVNNDFPFPFYCSRATGLAKSSVFLSNDTASTANVFVHINNIHKICIRPVSRAMHFNLYKFDYNPMIIVRLPKCSLHSFSLFVFTSGFFLLLILNPLDFCLFYAPTPNGRERNVHFVLDFPFFLLTWHFSNNDDSNIIRSVGIWFDIAIYDSFFIYSYQNINHNSFKWNETQNEHSHG